MCVDKRTRTILIRALILALFALPAFAQQGSIALPDLGSGLRSTNPDFEQPSGPFWHENGDAETDPPVGFTFIEDAVATAIDFRLYCSAPEGYTGTGTRVVTLASGSLPAGLSLGTSQLTGTPTTTEVTNATFTCTLDGDGTADQTFSLTVEGTDTTPPPVPANLSCGPSGGTSQNALTCTWGAVTDPSGILEYRSRYASTEALCNSEAFADNTLLQNSTATTAQITGLVASETRWVKVRSRDNSAAQNLSAWTSCAPGTTSSGGGGGTADIWADDFETGTEPNITHWSRSANVTGSGSCTLALISTGGADSGSKFLRATLVANPTANDAGGGSYRCEVGSKAFLHTPPDGLVEQGDTVYYGISYRMPAATPYDSVIGDTLTQMFQNIGDGAGCHESITVDNNALIWRTQDCTRPQGQQQLLSSFPKDTWVRVCQVYKWEQNATGFHKIWVNPTSASNTPTYSYSGQTLINDLPATTDIIEPQYIGKVKVGNYKSGWRTTRTAANQEAMTPRLFDIDDVRVATNFAGACL